MTAVLDASALIAWLRGEPGADRVREILGAPGGALISAVNLCEVLQQPDGDLTQLVAGTDPILDVRPFGREHAGDAAALFGATRAAGLGLADRACLALARATGGPAITTDRAWSTVDVGVEVVQIR